MVTVSPGEPLAGEKPLMLGGGMTVKGRGESALPRVLVTVIGPVVAPNGTLVRSSVSLISSKPLSTPSNATASVPVKLLPRTKTESPSRPDSGIKAAIVGGAALSTVNGVGDLASPHGVATVINPVSAPVGTVALIWVSLSI